MRYELWKVKKINLAIISIINFIWHKARSNIIIYREAYQTLQRAASCEVWPGIRQLGPGLLPLFVPVAPGIIDNKLLTISFSIIAYRYITLRVRFYGSFCMVFVVLFVYFTRLEPRSIET
jgi:hypothetical protein